jgi:hypothetical protein
MASELLKLIKEVWNKFERGSRRALPQCPPGPARSRPTRPTAARHSVRPGHELSGGARHLDVLPEQTPVWVLQSGRIVPQQPL